MKIDHGVGAADRGGELAQRLAHQARLHAGLGIAHLALELGARHQGRDRIDHQHLDRAGAHQRIGDLQRLLPGVGLGDQEVVDIDAELARIDRIERVLGIDEGADAAALLGLGDAMQRQRRLARGFRPVDFHHPAARQAADPERDVEAERAARNGLDLDRLAALAEPHDRALAEGPFDLRQRGIERLGLVHCSPFDHSQRVLGHVPLLMTGIRRTGKRALRGPCRDEVDVLYMICSQFAICSFWRCWCWPISRQIRPLTSAKPATDAGYSLGPAANIFDLVYTGDCGGFAISPARAERSPRPRDN